MATPLPNTSNELPTPSCSDVRMSWNGGIVSDLQERMPWNYCDYRCEVCRYQGSCTVYHASEVERRLLAIEGKDPDDPVVVAGSVAKMLAEVTETLRQDAARFGIDLDEAVKNAPVRDHKFGDDPLSRQARDLTLRISKFIRTRGPDAQPAVRSGEGIEAAWDDLIWYHTLMSAKTARAVVGLENAHDWPVESGVVPDYQVSAGIALKSIHACRQALGILRPSLAGAEADVDSLTAGLDEIRDLLQSKFERPF